MVVWGCFVFRELLFFIVFLVKEFGFVFFWEVENIMGGLNEFRLFVEDFFWWFGVVLFVINRKYEVRIKFRYNFYFWSYFDNNSMFI